MASIERRAQTWRVVWREDGGKRGQAFRTESEAVAFRALLDRNGGRLPDGWDAGGRTVGDLVTEWADSYAVKPSNRARVRNRWRTMAGGHPIAKAAIADVTSNDARDFVNELAGRYAEGTVRNLVKNVRAAYRYATERGYFTGPSPFAGKIDIQSAVAKTESVFLRADERARLVEALPAKYRLFVRLLLGSGLRIGEAYALRVHSARTAPDGRVTLRIDKSADLKTQILGPTKTRKTRLVALSLELSREISELAEGRDPSERLFPLIPYPTLHDAYGRAVKRAGLLGEHPNGVRIHDLRHTHASDLIMAGVPLLKVSRRLGHASIVITADTYGHIHADDETLNSELDRLA